MHTTLVSTDTLAVNLHDGWALIDCRFDLQRDHWGHDQYREAHIPGAMYASLNDDLASTRSGINGRHPLPSPEAMAATFGRLGIDTHTQVVAYDQDSGMYASRLWWMLRYCGHDAVAVLDGGWAKWMREGRPTRAGDETRQPTVFVPRMRDDARLTIEQMAPLAGNPDVLLVDARGAERFEGRTEPLDRVAGHIPGARNHYFRQNVRDDGTMLPADQLRAQFEQTLQGRPAAETVMYCGSGVSACHNLLAMELAGLPGAKLYPGSWSEWSSDPRRPVATGPAE